MNEAATYMMHSPYNEKSECNKVEIYKRLSDEDRDKRNKEDESESLLNQESMLRAYSKERGLKVFDVYCDEDRSGADRERPDWNRLIADAEKRKFNIVLCKTQSRFSRDMEMVEKYIHDKFLEWNIRFVSIVDYADTEVKGNKKSRQINGLINEWYLEDLSDNIRRTLNHKKQNGDWMGSFAPYGYMRDPENKNHMAIDEEAAEIVRKIFDMFVGGKGYYSIAQELNDRRILNPSSYKKEKGSKFASTSAYVKTAGLWIVSTIYYILRKEEYIGTLCQNKTENISYKNQKRKSISKDKWTRTFNAHEPIIDIKTWNRVQEKLATRTRPHTKTGKKHLFAGKVFCEDCQNTMIKIIATNTNGKPSHLKCKTRHHAAGNCNNNRSIRFDVLEEIVLNEINKLISENYNPDEINLRDDSLQNKLDVMRKKKSKLEAQIIENNNVIELLYFDRVKGNVSDERFFGLVAAREDDIKSLKNQISQIDINMESVNDGLTDEELNEKFLTKYEKVEALTPELIEEFVKAIYIGKVIDKYTIRDIKIVWNYQRDIFRKNYT